MGLGFGVWGLSLRVEGLGLGDLPFRVWGVFVWGGGGGVGGLNRVYLEAGTRVLL